LIFDGISKYQYAINTNNCSSKRAFSSRIGSFIEIRPPLWLSSITLRYAAISRIPLAEGSTSSRDLYLKKHNTYQTHIYALAGFEHANPASQWS